MNIFLDLFIYNNIIRIKLIFLYFDFIIYFLIEILLPSIYSIY
jgi:hypothetical protein